MSLHELVVVAAARYPERTAVVGPDGTLTYAGLDARANGLAAALRDLGVRPGDLVALLAEKTPDTVAAMQAVLRVGAAYVPIDPNAPPERAARILADCGAEVLVGTTSALDGPRETWARHLSTIDIAAPLQHGAGPANHPSRPDDLAYVLYTSGSTGTPKGVCLTHRNARAFVDWAVSVVQPTPEDRFANHAALTFDLSVLDVYAALATGAAVHLVPAGLALAPARLVDLLHRDRISVWYSVPSVLALMLREGGLLERPAPPALRAVLFAGEPFPVAQVRKLAEWTDARLLNLYGPTETNVCTFHEVRTSDLERDRPPPIGRAASGDNVWVMAPGGQRCEVGDVGELVVEGPSVMVGYWGRDPHRGPYRTGDLVRVLPDGVLDYIGREDGLVKVHGHRVEVGEVEAALADHPDVDEVAVTAVKSEHGRLLHAWVVPVPGRTPGPLALRSHSARRLPAHMIAEVFRLVTELPRNGNGKVDRAALAEWSAKDHGSIR